MPVKSRKVKAKHSRITPDAAAAFKEALPLRLHREMQLSIHDECPGIDHCEVCQRYEELVAVITTALGIHPADIHPIDVADVPAPPWFEDRVAEAWEKARELYCGLADAAGIERAPSVLPTDLMRHQAIIRWAERNCRVPEGSFVGQRLRLREFQRDVVRRIYGSGFGVYGEDIKKAMMEVISK